MSNDTETSEFHGPGIIGLMMSRPELAKLYSRITDMLLSAPPGSSLPRAFRERMAAAVSRANECAFCEESHCAVAQVVTEREGALDMPWGKRVALMTLAIEVTKAPSADQKAAVARAMRDATEHAGATSDEIHDTVLIAAWFSFLNRYVSAMNPAPYGGIEQYLAPAQMLAEAGYEATLDAMAPRPEPKHHHPLPSAWRRLKVGRKLFRFESKHEWINWATRFYRNAGVRLIDTIAIDQFDRVCRKGLEFERAEREGAYPIIVYALDNAEFYDDPEGGEQ